MTDRLDQVPAQAVTAYVALGANLGQRETTLEQAVDRIAQLPQTRIAAVSSLYETEPIDSSGPDYANAVVKISTQMGARALLRALQTIEQMYGRVRPQGVVNAPRTLDLDVLLYDDWISSDRELVLPHPRMHQRAFVLVPLLEIEPGIEIPGRGPAQVFYATLTDQRIVKSNRRWIK